MKKQFHTEEVIKREQARMQKRACRPHLYGKKITVPTRNGSMHAFVYNSKNLHPGYLIVEVHGGGFMYNTAADDDDFCHFIHQTLGIPVISCDYSLTPEHPFPTGLEDIYDCVLHALSVKELKARPDKIILWGHSAGANLAAGTVYMAGENQQFTPCMQILDYPYMDPYRSSTERKPIKNSVSGKLMDTFAHYYTESSEELRNVLISPVLFPAETFTDMPPTFILLCGRDNLNQGGKEYGLLLRKAKVPVTFYYVREALHGFIENHFNYEYIPVITKIQITRRQHELAEKSVKHICRWITEQIKDL